MLCDWLEFLSGSRRRKTICIARILFARGFVLFLNLGYIYFCLFLCVVLLCICVDLFLVCVIYLV